MSLYDYANFPPHTCRIHYPAPGAPVLAARVRELLAARASPAPHARLCHPREEHLLPLMVAVGAAGADPGRRMFNGTILGKAVSAYHFN